MGGWRSWALTLALLATACVGATSCGDEPGAEEEIASALEQVREDFDARRAAAVCARTSTGPRCPTTVGHLLDRAAASTSSVRSGEREVVGVKVRGGTATATVTLSDRVDGRLRFVRGDGRWKLADLGIRADLERSRWKDVPAVLEDPQDPDTPLPCPPILRVVHHGPRPVRGGCVLRLASDDMAIVMLTAFGDFAVARCGVRLAIHMASNSTGALADQIEFRGRGICAKARACRDGETGLRYPWQGDTPRGTLAAGMHLRFDICVNTPLGRARGMLHYRLAKQGGELVATPYDYPIGESSLQLRGAWDVKPDRFGPPAPRR